MQKDNNNLLAILGPTNTGKTFRAFEKLFSYSSGIFGFIFWLYILNILIKRFKENVFNAQSVDPIFVFMFTLCFWDILFSPYGSNRIILLPLYLVFLFRYKNMSN